MGARPKYDTTWTTALPWKSATESTSQTTMMALSVTSTLEITANPVIDSVSCIMKQDLSSSTIPFGQPVVGVESRPPPIRTLTSVVQLTVTPAPTGPTTAQPETTWGSGNSTDPPSEGEKK